MEIIEERLEREFNLDLITTVPSVIYKITKKDGTVLMIDNPLDFPVPEEIDISEEPIVKANILTPNDYVGSIMQLCQDRRGTLIDMKYMENDRV